MYDILFTVTRLEVARQGRFQDSGGLMSAGAGAGADAGAVNEWMLYELMVV